MIRFRTSLLLLALAALFIAGAPVAAATGDSALPSRLTAPAVPALDANLCKQAAASREVMSPPFDDFILCTCKLCEEKPDEICQISPSGYSIVCSDWYRTHC